MSGVVLVIGILVAFIAVNVSKMIVTPPRRLSSRVAPYTQLNRSKLGRGADISAISSIDSEYAKTAMGRVFGPMGQSLADSLSQIIDAGDDDYLSLRLRQAGFLDTSPSQYRLRQLVYTVLGSLGFAALGFLYGSTLFTLVGFFGGGLWGATVWRGRVNKAIKTRRERMRIELYTVAQLIAMQMRTGHGSVASVQHVVYRGRGPVVRELAEALSWMSGGMAQADAYDRLALETPEPTAGRLYRALADGVRSGGDLAATLLSISDDLRGERREEMERSATKRRGAMLIPTIVIMAPIVLLFLLAPLPRLLSTGG